MRTQTTQPTARRDVVADIDEQLFAHLDKGFVRAAKAWAVTESMLPEFRMWARTLTKDKDIKLELTPSGSRTDGETIYITPQLGLADLPRHTDTRTCKTYDPVTRKSACAACRVLDWFKFLVFHECAHIVEGSFGEGGWDSDANDPHLLIMMNVLEDSRINARTVEKMPGSKRWFEMSLIDYCTNGIEDFSTGKNRTYADLDEDMQALLGAHIRSSRFHDISLKDMGASQRVLDLLDLHNVRRILDETINMANVARVKSASIELLKTFRDHGFLELAKKPKPEPGEGQPEPNQPSDESDPNGESGDGGNEPEPGNEPGEGGDSASGNQPSETEPTEPTEKPTAPSGDGKSEQQEQLSPEEMQKLMNQFGGHGDIEKPDSYEQEDLERASRQGEVFDVPSRDLHGITMIRFDRKCELTRDQRLNANMRRWDLTGTGPGRDRQDQPQMLEAEKIGRSLRQKAARVFANNKPVAWSKPERSGHVRPSTGRKLAVGSRDALFRRQRADKRSYSAIIMVDFTGSTSAVEDWDVRPLRSRQGMQLDAAVSCVNMLDGLGIPTAMYGFGTAQRFGLPYQLGLAELKAFNERLTEEVKSRFTRCGLLSLNADGLTLEWARKQMQQRKETDRIILYFTDGGFPHKDSEQSLIFQKNIELCKRDPHLKLLAVNVCTDDLEQFDGIETVGLRHIEDTYKVVERLESMLH